MPINRVNSRARRQNNTTVAQMQRKIEEQFAFATNRATLKEWVQRATENVRPPYGVPANVHNRERIYALGLLETRMVKLLSQCLRTHFLPMVQRKALARELGSVILRDLKRNRRYIQLPRRDLLMRVQTLVLPYK